MLERDLGEFIGELERSKSQEQIQTAQAMREILESRRYVYKVLGQKCELGGGFTKIEAGKLVVLEGYDDYQAYHIGPTLVPFSDYERRIDPLSILKATIENFVSDFELKITDFNDLVDTVATEGLQTISSAFVVSNPQTNRMRVELFYPISSIEVFKNLTATKVTAAVLNYVNPPIQPPQYLS